MNTIISFRANNYQQNNGLRLVPKQPQNQQPVEDSFEFVDSVIEEDIKPAKVVKTKLANAKLLASAWNIYDEVRHVKNNTEALLSVANSRGYSDMLNLKGNPVTFSEDQLGRIVMTEKDAKGKDACTTTVSPSGDKVIKIETSDTQMVFFDYGKEHTEVTKISSKNLLGGSIREVYCYEHGKPITYSKYKQSLFKEDELVERCKF